MLRLSEKYAEKDDYAKLKKLVLQKEHKELKNSELLTKKFEELKEMGK